MICPSCSTVNESGRKFCRECGTRLNAGCPNCGAQNPPNAKFCGECGTTLVGAVSVGSGAPFSSESHSSGPSAERRLVTVLFADLVGFTTMAQDEDPEDTREFLTRYFDLARTIVDRYGGTIEKFIGDAVMAVWGAPTTHEDDAERAVRAALELVDGVPGISETRSVQARAGVLTGQAAITLGATGQGMVAGDLVNTASRLQSVAPPGTVLVGEATRQATARAIRFEEAGEQLLKGKSSPVPAFRAAAVIGLRGGNGRADMLEPPFTGRDDDLRLLKDLFHATQREHKARLVSIVGQGGIGKSRLAWEFEKYIDGVADTVYWHHGRSPAYGEGISYWALAEMVRGRAGIAEMDDAALAVTRLHETLLAWLPDEQERRWVEPRLAGLLALDVMPSGSRDELFAAWRTFFERVAGRGPAVLVFEDIQWADEGLLDFVAELLDRSRNLPIFVVALTRPELFDRRPGWGSNQRSLTTTMLEPLARADMVQLVTGTVPGIPDEATDAIVDRAEGIPLYAVETIRMLLDREDLHRLAGGTFEISGTLDELAVPHTLQALIGARLDGLGERERRLIQSAAVMGKSFTAASLAAVSGEPMVQLDDQLTNLVRRQMLQVEVDPRSSERGQYQFVQAVVREIAETSLSRGDRRTLHLAAARYYESLGDDELAGVQAGHYVEAYRATPAGPEADALAAQARVSLRAAAERAIALHSNRRAVSYLEEALAVTPDLAEQATLHERAVRPAVSENLVAQSLEHVRAAVSIHRQLGNTLGTLQAITLEAWVELSEHHERTAIALLRPALAEVEGHEPATEIVEAQAELARALMVGGDYHEAVALTDAALTASGMVRPAVVTDLLITKGTAMTNMRDRAVEGEILLRGAIQVAERHGDTWSALRAMNNALGVIAAESGRAADEMMRNGYDIALRHGLLTWGAQFVGAAMTNAFEMGDWDAWLDEASDLGAPGFYAAWLLVETAGRDAMRGRIEEARIEVAKAKEMVGTASTQANAAMSASDAQVDFAAGDWSRAMNGARESWIIAEAGDFTMAMVAASAVAANQPDWIREALAALLRLERGGRQIDGLRSGMQAALAMLEGRWTDARGSYGDAQRDLSATDSNFALALVNLMIGTRGTSNMPEAADAMSAAREFFTTRGAESFLKTYQTAMVPLDMPASRSGSPEAVPNPAR